MPEMDYSKLFGKMAEKGITQKKLAEMAGLGRSQLNLKLKGRYAFKQSEIDRICTCLDILPCEIGAFFFTPKVEKTQLSGVEQNNTLPV